MKKKCLNCGYTGYVYGIPIGNRVSAPFCPQCGINNKLVDVANLKSSNNKYMAPQAPPKSCPNFEQDKACKYGLRQTCGVSCSFIPEEA